MPTISNKSPGAKKYSQGLDDQHRSTIPNPAQPYSRLIAGLIRAITRIFLVRV
jgi:hypothetical protein